jgi:hypothetical protein
MRGLLRPVSACSTVCSVTVASDIEDEFRFVSGKPEDLDMLMKCC